MQKFATPGELARIALLAGRTGLNSYEEFENAFQRALGCELDYARRLLNGTRPVRKTHRDRIRALLRLPTLNFESSGRDFAIQLGMPRGETERLLGPAFGAFDFASRTSDSRSIQQLFHLIGGYWECVFWSFSRRDCQAVSRGICNVDRIDENNLLRCEMVDVNFAYSGVIFPVLQHLYFFLEKDRLFDEVSVFLTSRPDRAPAVLRGILLGLSGGVDEIHSYPGASKVAFRHLGKNANEIRAHYPDCPPEEAEVRAYLESNIVGYISRDELDNLPEDDPLRLQILRIDNEVDADSIPFVLTADT